MSAMKDIATELELYWRETATGSYLRTLPNHRLAVIYTLDRGYSLQTDQGRQEFDTLPQAVKAAGEIAKAQLKQQAMTWT